MQAVNQSDSLYAGQWDKARFRGMGFGDWSGTIQI